MDYQIYEQTISEIEEIRILAHAIEAISIFANVNQIKYHIKSKLDSYENKSEYYCIIRTEPLNLINFVFKNEFIYFKLNQYYIVVTRIRDSN
jgi:hypothetical protein